MNKWWRQVENKHRQKEGETVEWLEKNNEFQIGAAGGWLAGAVMFFFVEAFHWAGLTRYDIIFIAGETVFTYSNTWYHYLLGLMVHAGISVFWGVALLIFLNRCFNRRLRYLKFTFCSFMVFFYQFGFLDEVFGYPRALHLATLDLAVYLAGKIIYGIVLCWYVDRAE